jgi:glycosyltransferase involved in cell wall biosynthesis
VKIAIVTKRTRAHGFGGVETNTENTARAMTDLGHEVTVLTTAHPAGRTSETWESGARVRYLADVPPARDSAVWWRRSADAVGALCADGHCDLVLSTNLSGYGVAMARLPVLHYVLCTGRTLAHLVSEWHDRAGIRQRLAYGKHALALFYYAWLERRLYARVDTVLAEDDALYENLRAGGWPTRPFYAGVEPRRFRADSRLRAAVRRALGIPTGDVVLLMVATINRQKGIWLGVEAFERLAETHRGLHLIVVGDGPDRARLERALATTPAGPRAHFTGAVAPEATDGYYAAADLLLYPTFRIEGIPRAVLEAMASEVPVVATNRGGIRTAVVDGITGVLVPTPTLAPLVDAVEGLLTDPPRRQAMGAASRARVLTTFDVRVVIADLLDEVSERRRVVHAAR